MGYKNPETVRKHMALMANDGSVDAMPQQAREIPEAIDILQSAPNHDAKFVKYYGNPYYYGGYGNPYYYGRYYFGYNVMKVADPMKVTAKMKVAEVEPVSEEAEPEFPNKFHGCFMRCLIKNLKNAFMIKSLDTNS